MTKTPMARANVCAAAVVISLLAAFVPARAQTAGVSGSVALVSNYVFRGLTQTDGNPALQGSLEFDDNSGFYAGAWASNISWFSDANPQSSVSLEIDLYLGWRHPLSRDWNADAGVYRYQYPGSYGSLNGVVKPNTTEIYAGIGWKWVSIKGYYSVADTFGVPDSSGASYLVLSAAVPVGEWSFGAHIGRQEYHGQTPGVSSSNAALYSYTDYGASVTRSFGSGFSVSATASRADVNPAGYTVRGHNLGGNWYVLSVQKSF